MAVLLLSIVIAFCLWLGSLLGTSTPKTIPADNLTTESASELFPGTDANAHVLALPSLPPKPQIAIILDDLGNQWENGKRSALLAGAVTLSILPNSPYALKLAQLGREQGKELMLHAPMEPIGHQAWNGGLSETMAQKDLRASLLQMVRAVPGVAGVNNHMGSALTQNQEVMGWVMDTLREQNLFFVDSRTSPQSRAWEAAQARQLPSAKRDVFLDNVRTHAAIELQLGKLITLAKQRGFALAIGHPYPETLTVLEHFLQRLPAQAVRLVSASQVVEHGSGYYVHRPQVLKPPPNTSAFITSPSAHSKSI